MVIIGAREGSVKKNLERPVKRDSRKRLDLDETVVCP